MTQRLVAALEHLCARGSDFDRILPVLRKNRQEAVPILVRLLSHPDPNWRRAAAAALARLRTTPARALPALLRMLKSHDVAGQIAAIAALDWLPRGSQAKAVPAVVRVLRSRPAPGPAFTRTRANLPRAVAAHFLGLRGGARGYAALSDASQRTHDPILYQVQAALENAGRPRKAKSSGRRTTR